MNPKLCEIKLPQLTYNTWKCAFEYIVALYCYCTCDIIINKSIINLINNKLNK